MTSHDPVLLNLEALVADDIVLAQGLDGLDAEAQTSFLRGPEIPRIRPILVVLAARASGQVSDPDLQRAAELLHGAMAVHDLALGREGGLRRRIARKVLTRSASWIGGNHLTLRAIELASAARPDVLGDLLATVREVSEGHALMAELQTGRVPTEEDWLEHADTHTGSLFAFCCKAAAKTSQERGVAEALGRYGRHLGRLWHIAEDLSLFTHDQAAPAIVARALAGRPMLPVALAIQESRSVGRLWTQLVHHPSEATASWVVTMVGEAGGLIGARERLLTESWNARQALCALPPSAARSGLEKVVQTVLVAAIKGPRNDVTLEDPA